MSRQILKVNVSLQSLSQPQLCGQMLELMTREDRDGLLIVTSTQRISVSSKLLQIFSPLYRDMLRDIPSSDDPVTMFLPDYKAVHVHHLLDLLTSGRIKDKESPLGSVEDILNLAKCFKIDLREPDLMISLENILEKPPPRVNISSTDICEKLPRIKVKNIRDMIPPLPSESLNMEKAKESNHQDIHDLIQVADERDVQDENEENMDIPQNHMTDGRLSNAPERQDKMNGKKDKASCRISVRPVTEILTKEDLWDHFEAFGEVTEVCISKPFCQVAFVQFSECKVAQSLLGKELLIKGVSVKIGEAAPRGRDDRGNMRGGGGGGDMFWEDRSGDYDSTGGGGSDGGWGGGNKGGFVGGNGGGFSMNLGSGALESSFSMNWDLGRRLCRYCLKNFGQNSLKRHMKDCRVRKFMQLPFKCRLCEMGWTNQHSLSTHICMKKQNPMHIRF